MSPHLRTVSFMVNGDPTQVQVAPRQTLAEVLREDLYLTGTHLGCEQGQCGACTVLVDSDSVRSCLVLGVQVDGRRVETVEGLCDEDGGLGDIQTAFRSCHALQCGFCTPGFLCLTRELVEKHEQIDDELIGQTLTSARCRCTGYAGIQAAMTEAARGRGRYVGNTAEVAS